MSERSTLQLRVRPHFHPDRQEDIVVEVMRAGEVAATIYGSREGVHVVGGRVGDSQSPFGLHINGVASWVVPLLLESEDCPWCKDGLNEVFGSVDVCPVCGARRK